MKRKTLGVAWVAVFSLSALVAPLGGAPGSGPPGPVDANAAEIGDVVATGSPIEGGCDFSGVQVRTEMQPADATRWVSIAFLPSCDAVVTSKWQGAFSAGPPGLVGGLGAALLAADSPLVPEEGAPTQGGSIDACETSYQHVFMYGYGGWYDSLTHKNGNINFCYNGSTATLSSHWGNCQGSDPPGGHYWTVDSCVLNSVGWGPGSVVWRTGTGSYHCQDPNAFPCNISEPNGYYHSLWDDEDGHSNGVSHCTYGWSGQVIYTGTQAHIGREILQGCT